MHETAEDLFHACDLDNDGFIDREELRYAINKRSGKELDDASLDKLLKTLDSDGDGRISYDDFVLQFDSLAGGSAEGEDYDDETPLAPPMSPGEFEEKMRWIFSFFDKDGDGVVTIEELKALLNEIKMNNNLESADQEIENFIQQLDKEDRGHIGFTQFFRAIERIIDPTEDPLPMNTGGGGDKTHNKKRARGSWVAPESIVSMIRKRSDSSVTEYSENNVAGLTAQVENYKRTIETLKAESDQFLARANMLATNLREVKDNNEKLQEENTQLNEKIQQNKRSIKQNEKLQRQNRELEANLELLKTEVTKMKEQSRDLQRSCTKLKLEKDLLNDDLYIKRRDLQTAEDKLQGLEQSAAELGPTIRKSLSNPTIPVNELEKLQEENQLLRTTLEREQKKVGQMVKLLNEDNEQLKSQLKEDNALIESSNQIIKKLRQALEEASGFNSDPQYKNSLLSELEHDVAVRLTPRIGEIEDELSRSMTSMNSPVSPVNQLLRTSLSRGSIPAYMNGSSQLVSPNVSGLFSPPLDNSIIHNESSIDESVNNSIILNEPSTPSLNESAITSAESTPAPKENGHKIMKSESRTKLLKRINAEEKNAVDQINLFEELDDLEDKLTDLQSKYASLEKDYLKLQTENITLRTQPNSQDPIARKLSFSTPPLPAFLATPSPAPPTSSTPPSSNPLSALPPQVAETPTRPASPSISRASPIPSHTSSTVRPASPSTITENNTILSSPKGVPRLALSSSPQTPHLIRDTHKEEELKKAMDENVKLKDDLNHANQELTSAQQQLASTQKELTSAQQDLTSAQQKLRELSDTQETIHKKHEADIEAERVRVAEREAELETERSRAKAELETERDRAKTEREAELQAERDRAKAEREADLEAERDRAKAEREAELQAERDRAKAELEAERSRASEQVAVLEPEGGSTRSEREAELEAERDSARAELEAELDRARAELEAERSRVAEKEAELETERARVAERQAELEAERGRAVERVAVLEPVSTSAPSERETELEAERDSARAELEAERSRVAEREAELMAERGRVAEREAELEAERGRAATRDAELEAERGRAAARDAQLEADQGRVRSEREAELEAERDRAKAELETERSRVAQREAELEAERDRARVEREAELEAERGRAKAELEAERGRARAEREQWQKLQNFSEETSKKKLETDSTERIRLMDEEIQALKNANIVAEATLQKEASDARQMASQMRAAITQLEIANGEKNGAIQQADSLRLENAEAQDKINALEREIHSLRTAQKMNSPSLYQSQGIQHQGTPRMGGTGPLMKSSSKSRMDNYDGGIAMNVHDQDQESVSLLDESDRKESSCCCCIS